MHPDFIKLVAVKISAKLFDNLDSRSIFNGIDDETIEDIQNEMEFTVEKIVKEYMSNG